MTSPIVERSAESVERVSAGAYFENFRVQFEGDEQVYFLKCLHPYLDQDEDILSWLMNAARHYQGCQHPNLSELLAFGQEELPYLYPPHIESFFMEGVPEGRTSAYLLFSYVEHTSLRRLMRDAMFANVWLRPGLLAMLGVQMCETFLALLSHFREKGELPRSVYTPDVRPRDWLLRPDGLLTWGGFFRLPPHLRGRRAGVLVHSFTYMTPELVMDTEKDERVFVFVVGSLLYEYAIFRNPFMGDSDIRTLEAILRKELPLLHTIRRDIPPALSRILQRALAKKPKHRHQGLLELQSELLRFLDGIGKSFSLTPFRALYRESTERQAAQSKSS